MQAKINKYSPVWVKVLKILVALIVIFILPPIRLLDKIFIKRR